MDPSKLSTDICRTIFVFEMYNFTLNGPSETVIIFRFLRKFVVQNIGHTLHNDSNFIAKGV